MPTTPQEQTTEAFNCFDSFSDEQLAALLTVAGIVPCSVRGLMLQQALIVWFHGNIPSDNTFIALVNKDNPEFKG